MIAVNKTTEFVILLAGVILTRIGDIVGTYHYTPNLAAEANPIVYIFSAGWGYLLVIQIVAVFTSASLNYYSLFVYEPTEITLKNLTYKEYLSFL